VHSTLNQNNSKQCTKVEVTVIKQTEIFGNTLNATNFTLVNQMKLIIVC